MKNPRKDTLSRRERQIMDILYRQPWASVTEVHAALANRPSYSAVRATLRVLEEKGHARHRAEGPRYVFAPVVSREKAKRSALQSVVETFFEGSLEQAAIALLGSLEVKLKPEELERLMQLVKKAEEDGVKG